MSIELKSIIKIFITGCLWGTIGLFVKLMEGEGSSASYTSFLRLFFGALLLAVMTLIFDGFRAFRIGRRTLLSCMLLGVVCQGTFNMLYKLTQEQLASTLMPLGGLSKSEVRQIAKDAGLPVASKPDSQEVCFVTDGSYADFIEKTWDPTGCPRAISLIPTAISLAGTKASAIIPSASIPGLNAGEEISCTVKIRYRHGGKHAIISSGGGNTVKVIFEKPVRAPTPGQSAVFYDSEERIIGGGVIAEVR